MRKKRVLPLASPIASHGSSDRAEMTVPAFGRAKQVTDQLDDRVKARLRGDNEYQIPAGCTSSSGSEHGADDLSGFFHGCCFFSNCESSDGRDEGPREDEDELSPADLSDGEERQSCSFYVVPTEGMIRDLVNPRAASPTEDRFKRCLEADAVAAAAKFAGLRTNPASFRRAVMGSLRETGYDSGICKSRWKSGGGGLVAGTYEYIDVLTSSTTAPPQQRYLVDVDFAGEFDIARPTVEYARLAAELPRVFVGRPDALRVLLRVMAEAARRSLREREMHVPPWRRSRYLQAKWLGPHRRTVNFFSSSPSSSSSTAAAPELPAAAPIAPARGDVKCRFVGFDAASSPAIVPTARMI